VCVWVEVAGRNGHVQRFANHDLVVIDGAGCGHGDFGCSTKVEHQTGAQADTVEFRTAQCVVFQGYFVGKIVAGPLVVGFKEAERQRLPDSEIHAAANQRGDAVTLIVAAGRQTLPSNQPVGKEIHIVTSPSDSRPKATALTVEYLFQSTP